MSLNNKRSRSSGFTLIEMLVIAPIALLVITGFIALMVTMVGDVIAGRTSNVMTYDIQSALNTIEQDVRLSTQFLTTSGVMVSPQGKDNATAAFTSVSDDLILGGIATDKNPVDPTRSFVYYDTPFSCLDPAQVYKNRIFFITVVYFEQGGSLWKRTYVPTPSDTLCPGLNPWQVNTCAPGYSSGATQCQANDSEILKNVQDFTVSYFENPQDTVAISSAAATTASSVRVSIVSGKSAAGRTVTASSSGRSTKLSSQEINLPPPDSPIVSGSISGNEAIFTWPVVPSASSYIIRYNINGGAWITASENASDTIFSTAARRGDTISVKVFARNTTGTSADIGSNNASVAIPQWTACALQSGWADFGGGYETCGFTITSQGVVTLKGMIGGGSITSNTVLLNLPAGLRPSHRLIFQATISTNRLVRIDIETNGDVRISEIAAGATSTYINLSGITFIPSNSAYVWNTLTPINGWSNYGGSFSPLRSTTDAGGRVHTQGLVSRGAAALSSVISNMASSTAPSKVHVFPARMNDGYNAVAMHSNGTIVDRGLTSSWHSIQTMHYAAGHSGWQTLSPVAGNPADGQLGNGWVHYNNESNIYETPQFTKSADGMVTVKGMIRSGTATSGTHIAKLPTGYQPQGQHMFHLASQAGFARIILRSNGTIEAVLVNSTWTSLDGISFMTSQ